MKPPIKVAVLGGGCGGMAAAFWLTRTAHLRKAYEVTVYTEGWRLGGKGASGRFNGRVREHGLHMMMGFYDNVFSVLRTCYLEMVKKPDEAFRSFDEAITAQRQISLWIGLPHEAPRNWQPGNIEFPKWAGSPGDEPLELNPAINYMQVAVERLLELLQDNFAAEIEKALREWLPDELSRHGVSEVWLSCASAARTLSRPRNLSAAVPLLEVLREMQVLFKATIGKALRACFELGLHDRFRCYFAYCFIDVALAGLIGFLEDVQPYGESGYQLIDHLDFKQWLESHDADKIATHSPIVMSVYDLGFAFKDGDSSSTLNASAAAGAILRLFIRMTLTYKDAPLWKMNGGMGDIVFVPLYKTLHERGVKFKFFTRVHDIRTANDEISSIVLRKQVELKKGAYEPLVRSRFDNGTSWDCWPAAPLWSQICDGAALEGSGVDFEDCWTQDFVSERTLVLGQDFDNVVLAIPPAAARHLTASLAKASAKWSDMIANTSSVATRSVQVWLDRGLSGLGWLHGPTVAVGHADPLRAWADMSHLLPFEVTTDGARSCEYLCGTLKTPQVQPSPGSHEPSFKPGANTQARMEADNWLAVHTGTMWPKVARADGSLDTKFVVDRYDRANVGYSELYVQTMPGSIRFRLNPGWRGFTNLYLAGDWTLTSINGGCAEAAFESGLRAACAITGVPPPSIP